MAKLTADRLDLDPPQVLVASTGVIGRSLPMDAVKSGIATACGGLGGDNGDAAARAIMTTDTVPKTAAGAADIGGATIRVGGMCKGAGMIHPNMATMLGFVTTDAAVAPGLMATLVKRVADRSFNQVSVDGDSSTNDSFVILANGMAGNRLIEPETPDAAALEACLTEVARELARSIARDGEGATKLITVRVTGAPDEEQARTAARAVVRSSLVKSAVHGGDPNWGRVVCALGYSGADLALDRLQLKIGDLTVFAAGAGVKVDLDAVRATFEKPEIEIHAELGLGDAASEAWGCDLSEEYVRINADYTT
jgi:glutamate N-acetyltransferase/amino-acid N-acetyltransferase